MCLMAAGQDLEQFGIRVPPRVLRSPLHAPLHRLRELTNDYQPPAGACTTWRALWHGLAALETALHEHIHLENNILFPRALAT